MAGTKLVKFPLIVRNIPLTNSFGAYRKLIEFFRGRMNNQLSHFPKSQLLEYNQRQKFKDNILIRNTTNKILQDKMKIKYSLEL